MSDAPERIWIDGGRVDNVWHENPEACLSPHGPYVRADLAKPKVKPLVENPCKELWYKNRIKDLEAKLEKAYANLDKLDPSGAFRSYDDE